MAASSRPKGSVERVRDFRARQRAQGLKLVQFWVPDVTTEAFKREAHRQSLAVSRSAGEREDQAFINSVSAIWQDDN